MYFPLKVPNAIFPKVMSTIVMSAFNHVHHGILFDSSVEMLNINL